MGNWQEIVIWEPKPDRDLGRGFMYIYTISRSLEPYPGYITGLILYN